MIEKIVDLVKRIKIPGLEGMSLYDLLHMYVVGIVRGGLTSRAGGISYSFFINLGGTDSPIICLTRLSLANSGIFQSRGKLETISNSCIVRTLASE